MSDDKKIFVLLLDEKHAAEIRPSKIHFFGTSYLTNGSEELIRSTLQFGLDDLREDEKTITHEDGLPFVYCVLKMLSFFVRTHVTEELKEDSRALEEFKKWFQITIIKWCDEKGLEAEVLPDKPGEFWRKAIITVPLSVPADSTTAETATS